MQPLSTRRSVQTRHGAAVRIKRRAKLCEPWFNAPRVIEPRRVCRKKDSVVFYAISVSRWLIFSEQFHHRGTEIPQSYTENILFPTDSEGPKRSLGPDSGLSVAASRLSRSNEQFPKVRKGNYIVD
jgi:hypothetical protein